MAIDVKALTGTVGEQATPGTIIDGKITEIKAGVAAEFMTVEQCIARKTEEDTRYINISIDLGEYGTKSKSFPDYSNPDDPAMPINPNSIHGRIIATYPDLKKGSVVNMVSAKKTTQNGSLIVWDMVLP